MAAVLSLFPGTAGAIDRPQSAVDASPSSPPSPQSPPVAQALAPIPARPVELWLGVIPGQVPPVLLAQLEMNGNPGIVVEGTAPGSPARKAGIMDMDIILRVADRPISNPEDLMTALQDHKPGDKIPVELLRGGKRQNVSVELAEAKRGSGTVDPRNRNVRKMIDQAIGAGAKPLPMGAGAGSGATEELDDPMAILQGLMSGMMQDSGFPDDDAPAGGAAGSPAASAMRGMILRHLKQGMGGMPMGRGVPGRVSSSAMSRTVRFSDGDGEISVMQNGGETKIEVYDRNGKLLFEGPYSTQEDMNNIPPDIKSRLGRVPAKFWGR